MTMTAYREILARRFGGVLSKGKHAPDGVACALEVASIARGFKWTDQPTRVGLPDLRPLNDARWSSDAARTAGLVPVVEALWDWASWPEARRVAWAQYVAIATVRDIVSEVVSEPHASACRRVTTCAEARAAAYAADAAAAAYAAAAANADAAADANAAYAAANADAAADAAARAVARAVAYVAASDRLLTRACAIWIEAAEHTDPRKEGSRA
jgi:hypothetical protein